MAVALDLQTCKADRLSGAGRLVQGDSEVLPQPFAGHSQDIVDAGLARSRLQIHPGATVQIEDVALPVDQRTGRGELLQEGLFGQLAQRQFHRRHRLSAAPAALCERRIDRRLRRQETTLGDTPAAGKVLLAPIELRLAVEHRKQVAKLANAFRCPEKQQATRIEYVVEQGDELLLQLRAHIDQQVPATDQIDPGEWRIPDHVLFGKHQHVADTLLDAIGAAIRGGGEKACQTLRREIGGNAGRIKTTARRRNGPAVNVGGEDLYRDGVLGRVQMFLQENRQRIGLFAG